MGWNEIMMEFCIRLRFEAERADGLRDAVNELLTICFKYCRSTSDLWLVVAVSDFTCCWAVDDDWDTDAVFVYFVEPSCE